MSVYVKAAINGNEPVFIFLNMFELDIKPPCPSTSQLVKCLKDAGFPEEHLPLNCVSFVSGGARVMLAKKSGIASRL